MYAVTQPPLLLTNEEIEAGASRFGNQRSLSKRIPGTTKLPFRD